MSIYFVYSSTFIVSARKFNKIHRGMVPTRPIHHKNFGTIFNNSILLSCNYMIICMMYKHPPINFQYIYSKPVKISIYFKPNQIDRLLFHPIHHHHIRL